MCFLIIKTINWLSNKSHLGSARKAAIPSFSLSLEQIVDFLWSIYSFSGVPSYHNTPVRLLYHAAVHEEKFPLTCWMSTSLHHCASLPNAIFACKGYSRHSWYQIDNLNVNQKFHGIFTKLPGSRLQFVTIRFITAKHYPTVHLGWVQRPVGQTNESNSCKTLSRLDHKLVVLVII